MAFVGRHAGLILANGAGMLVLVAALLAGWWEAAALGLAVLAMLDLMVLLRGRSQPGPEGPDSRRPSESEAERTAVERQE